MASIQPRTSTPKFGNICHNSVNAGRCLTARRWHSSGTAKAGARRWQYALTPTRTAWGRARSPPRRRSSRRERATFPARTQAVSLRVLSSAVWERFSCWTEYGYGYDLRNTDMDTIQVRIWIRSEKIRVKANFMFCNRRKSRQK